MNAAITFTDAPRPEAATQVRLEAFEGPLGLLLALIEQRQLDILTVRLGDLAGAYLEALASLEGDRLPHLSTFVAVASQLILIKSRAMLPAPPEPPALPGEEPPDPEEELRRRLLVYRVYRDAGQRLNLLLEEPRRLVHREAAVAAASGLAGARPAERAPYEAAWLVAALRRASDLALPPAPPAEVVARVITLTERAALIRRALAEAPLVVLQELLAGTQDRVLVAVTFLALLELIKRREVVAEQDVPWGPIRCRRTTTEERAAAGVAEAPPSPIDESLADFA